MRVPLNAVQPSNIRRAVTASQFLVGQDVEGHWVALESSGRGGGLFVTREAAVKYAQGEAGRNSAALIYANAPLAVWK
jgi:hypothetical protein